MTRYEKLMQAMENLNKAEMACTTNGKLSMAFIWKILGINLQKKIDCMSAFEAGEVVS